MTVKDGTASIPRLNVHHWGRLLVLTLLCCGLVAVVTFQHHGVVLVSTFRSEAGGLIGGRPISELLAADRPEHAWFNSDSQCRTLVTRFTRDHCLPLVYLASFPRSGNTWTRYLLEAATGIFTVSGGPIRKAYRKNKSKNFRFSDNQIWKAAQSEDELPRLGYLGESIPWPQGIGIVAKTHAWPEPWDDKEGDKIKKSLAPFPENTTRRAVLLIRDPFKSFISLKKYGTTKSILNAEDMTGLYRGEEWHKFVYAYAQIWYDINAHWLEYTNETHVIAYERLTRNTIGELTSLLRFLGVEPDRRRMQCVRTHLEGKAHNRRHGTVPDNETYPLQLRAHLWSYIHQLNWLLKDKGYPPLPLESYSFADEFIDIHMRS